MQEINSSSLKKIGYYLFETNSDAQIWLHCFTVDGYYDYTFFIEVWLFNDNSFTIDYGRFESIQGFKEKESIPLTKPTTIKELEILMSILNK
jgi:hypothetical protein